MTGTEYKRGVYGALQRAGFAKQRHALHAPGEGAAVLVNAEKGFGDQWFINAGFCLHRLDPAPVERVEKTHMYFRLERLFPAHRELILAASAIDEQGSLRPTRCCWICWPPRSVQGCGRWAPSRPSSRPTAPDAWARGWCCAGPAS